MALWGKKGNKPDSKSNGEPARASAVNGSARPASPTNLQTATAQAAPASTTDARIGQPANQAMQIASGPAPAQSVSPEEAQKRAAASKHLLMSFGEIVSVLMRSPQFKSLPLGEIEALVVPAVTTGQFLVAEAQSKANGFVTPIGIALWATVSEEVDRRLSTNLDQPFRLAPNEWKSGGIPWLVALAGDHRMINPMMKQLQETRLKGQPLKMRAKGQDGKPAIGTFSTAPGQDQRVPAAAS